MTKSRKPPASGTTTGQRQAIASAAGVLAVDELNAAVYDSVAHLNAALGAQESPDGAYWEALKKHYLFQDDLIMMNNGTVGPMPEPVWR